MKNGSILAAIILAAVYFTGQNAWADSAPVNYGMDDVLKKSTSELSTLPEKLSKGKEANAIIKISRNNGRPLGKIGLLEILVKKVGALRDGDLVRCFEKKREKGTYSCRYIFGSVGFYEIEVSGDLISLGTHRIQVY